MDAKVSLERVKDGVAALRGAIRFFFGSLEGPKAMAELHQMMNAPARSASRPL